MTPGDPAVDARAVLAGWAAEMPDLGYRDGMLLAAERAGLIEPADARAWRAEESPPPPPGASTAAAEAHLRTLLAGLRPMSRDDDAVGLRAERRFDAALGALDAAGLVDGPGWRARALAITAPWLDPEDVAEVASGGNYLYAIMIPPRDAAEAAADAEIERRTEALQRRGDLIAVLVARPVSRHDGTAVAAALLRTEAVEVVFHHVATDGTAGPGAFDGLTAPGLQDAAATPYAPIIDEPVDAHGSGGLPHRGPFVVTGTWRYTPAAPRGTRHLEVVADGHRWRLG